MPSQKQNIRGTTVEEDARTLFEGVISIDTDENDIRVHDGATAGGFRIALKSVIDTAIALVQTNLTTHTGDTANPHVVTKTQVGLANVTNDAQVKITDIGTTVQAHSSDLDAIDQPLATTDNATFNNISPTGTVDGRDIAADGATLDALDAAVVLQGTWDASVGTFPGGGTAQAGAAWIVSVGGTIDSVTFDVDDRIIAITDNASTSVFANNWHKSDNTDKVLSVNTQTGAVVLDADDISDAATTNKFVVAADITNLSNLSGTNTGDQTTEEIEDIAGALVATGGTKTNIAVTYQDTTGDMDFVVPNATDSVKGVIETATTAEGITGTATDKIPPVDVVKTMIDTHAGGGGYTVGSSATPSGTTQDITIPAGTTHILIPLFAVTTSGTSVMAVQLGDSGGIETSGYIGSVSAGAASLGSTSRFLLSLSNATSYHGFVALTLLSAATNTWHFSSNIHNTANNIIQSTAGTKDLSGTITTVRLTTVNGTDTFTGGTVNSQTI